MYGMQDEGLYWQDRVVEWGPRVLVAIAILLVAYVVARLARWAIATRTRGPHSTTRSCQ